MTPLEAVATAKKYLSDVFANEGIVNLGLEEIEFDEHSDVWNITLGFSRGWNRVPRIGSLFPATRSSTAEEVMTRDYRIVRVEDRTGKIVSLKLREIAA